MYRFAFIVAFMGISINLLAQMREEPIMLRTHDCDIQGTLVTPDEGSDIVVLIVSGAGAVDRDGNQKLMRSNAYRMYAAGLAANHIASVRYDKRGLGASRGRSFNQLTTLVPSYADDVKAWVEMLRKDDRFNKVVLAGHGEGALLGLIALTQGSDVDGYISIEGMGRTFDVVLKEQLSDQPVQIRTIAYQIVDSLRSGSLIGDVPIFLRNMFASSVQPYMISMFGYDPVKLIRRLKIPVLILHGSTDIQVAIEDARMLKQANADAKLVVIESMNHALKVCPTRDKRSQMDTFLNPAYPLSPILVDESVKFIKAL